MEIKKCGFNNGSEIKKCTNQCQFYETCTRNPYKNNEKEKKVLGRDIFLSNNTEK